VSLPIVTAADGGAWEARLLGQLAAPGAPLAVVRRCVDVVELAAVAASAQAVAALVDARLRRLDAGVVQRIAAAGVAVVGVLGADVQDDTERLRAAGIAFAAPADAAPAVFADVVRDAVAAMAGDPSTRAYADPAGGAAGAGRARPAAALAASAGSDADVRPVAAMAESPAVVGPDGIPGSQTGSNIVGKVIAVWGPTGAPGRSTVAVNLADEIARAGAQCMLVDGDVYGGVVANLLGLLDESPGLVAACRQAQSHRLDAPALAALCWQLGPALRVLTGLARAERWPEIRPAALQQVLTLSREHAEYTVLDLGFCLETDEELSFDTIAPRRHGATLAALEAADLVLAVGAADPVGMQRLIRGLEELRSLQLSAPVWVVLNRTRAGGVPGDPEAELAAALLRFAGRVPAAMLPDDRAAVDRAAVAGKPLAEVAGNGALRLAMKDLAAAATGRPAPVRARGHRRRSSVRGS
jgi:MinD-like ATPase involved in chromosome partitioning or flagellar assembly